MALNPYFPDVWLHFQAQAAAVTPEISST